jgi:hypothetical protein
MSGLALGIVLAVQRQNEHVRTSFIINVHFDLCWMSGVKWQSEIIVKQK